MSLNRSARTTNPDEDEQFYTDVNSPPTPPIIEPRTTSSEGNAAALGVQTHKTCQHQSEHCLKTIAIPHDLVAIFSQVAASNTEHNIETCGILSGTTNNDVLKITHLLIPTQSGSANSCSAEREEDMVSYQTCRDLITLGWIHTHPSQTAFLSSVDLHTQLAYQLLMPEAIAIVYSPTYEETGFYHLTTHDGLNYLKKCHQTGFHPHQMEPPLFETTKHTKIDRDTNITLVDLRCQ